MTTPLIVAGPPGVGKTFIIRILEQKTSSKKIVFTTNKPTRPCEIQNDDYNFIPTSEFLEKQNQGLFVFTNFYHGYHFGLERNAIENIQKKNQTPIVEIYLPKITQYIQHYPQLHAVFLLPESLTFIEENLQKRGDSQEEIASLLEKSLLEIEQFNDYFRYLFDECYIINKKNCGEIAKDIIKRYIVQ